MKAKYVGGSISDERGISEMIIALKLEGYPEPPYILTFAKLRCD